LNFMNVKVTNWIMKIKLSSAMVIKNNHFLGDAQLILIRRILSLLYRQLGDNIETFPMREIYLT